MNAAAITFATAIFSVVAAAAVGIGMADRLAEPAAEVVTLERVVVVGQRADAERIVKLPRVVIEHRRDTAVAARRSADLPV